MANPNTVPWILPSTDYHTYSTSNNCGYYLDSVDSLKENWQYPEGYFYSSHSTQNSPEISGVQLSNTCNFTHFEYPRPHLDEHVAWLPQGSAPPRHAQAGVSCDPRGPAHAESLSTHVAASAPLQPLSVKQPIDSHYKNDQTEIKEPHEESLDILDLDSILAAYQGNETEQPKSFYDLTQIGTQRQVRDQNVIYKSEASSNWPDDVLAAMQMPSAQPFYPVSSALPRGNSKPAHRKSNGARRLKTFNCTVCAKWFTSSAHLKRHYSTSIHKNSVRTSGQPDLAAEPTSHRAHAGGAAARACAQPALAPHSQPAFSYLRGNPYTSGSLDTSGTAVPEPNYTPLYSGQNQQHITFNHQNVISREVTHISANNPSVASPDPSRETSPESGDVVEQGSSNDSADGQLPNFAQLQAQGYGTDASNFFNRMDQQREHSLASKPVEEFVSIRVPLNGYMMEEKSKQELQISKHEPAIGPERAKAGDSSVSPSLSPPAAPAPAPHECRACGKRFSRACYLTQHNNSSHSGSRPFKCMRCGKRFADEAARARHGARHVGRKPFGCDACPKSFNHKSDLRRHMCLHTAGKPFPCALCGKGFVRRDHMLKHVNTHAKRVARDPSWSSSSPSP